MDIEAVPKSPLNVVVLFMVLISSCKMKIMTPCTNLQLGGSNWLGETKEWKRQVNESVLVVFDLCLSIDNLPENSDYCHTINCKLCIICTFKSSRQTKPVTRAVVVAIAGIIFPAINFVL
jgi:hypothetical protein